MNCVKNPLCAFLLTTPLRNGNPLAEWTFMSAAARAVSDSAGEWPERQALERTEIALEGGRSQDRPHAVRGRGAGTWTNAMLIHTATLK